MAENPYIIQQLPQGQNQGLQGLTGLLMQMAMMKGQKSEQGENRKLDVARFKEQQRLSGLSETRYNQAEAKQEEEKQRLIRVKQGAVEAYKTGDPNLIAQYGLANPEIADMLNETQQWRSDQTKENAIQSAFKFIQNPDSLPEIQAQRQEFLKAQGLSQDQTQETDMILDKYEKDPEGTVKKMELFLAANASDRWLKYQEAIGVNVKAQSSIGKIQADVNSGLITEKQAAGEIKKSKEYAPSNLRKMIKERQEYIDQGYPENSPVIKAFDDKISGGALDIEEMTPDEIDTWGAWINLTGKMPSLGRGKESTKMRAAIAKSAARQVLGADELGVPEGTPSQTPSDAALEMVGSQADTKSIQGSMNFLDKQISAMGSFVTNLNYQVDKVGELSKDLKTFDTRLLNAPLRAVRSKIKGSPLQAKYDMYLTEIESEIGKLATGSAASVSELSVGAQERWDKIHDKNLSIKDMLSLLEETRNAANMRMNSVASQYALTRSRMRTRDFDQMGAPAQQPGATEDVTQIPMDQLMQIAFPGGQ